MPTSTQKGFSVGKWETYYLRGRYTSHRNKVAAAKPAIDSRPPDPRPHVHYKQKKGLDEKRRQTCIMIENLRILNKTSEIMSGSDYNYYHHESGQHQRGRSRSELESGAPRGRSGNFHQEQLAQRQSQPISLIMRKNTHVMLRWFLRRFGQYVPWWAQLTY